MRAITTYWPQTHELDLHYRKMIVEITHLADIDIDDFTGQGDFAFFLENFGVIKTGFAGDETTTGLVGDFRPHGFLQFPGEYLKTGMTIFWPRFQYHSRPAYRCLQVFFSGGFWGQGSVFTAQLFRDRGAGGT